MKKLMLISLGFAFLTVMLSASQVFAQSAVEETTTTTTTSSGTIGQFGPDTIVVKTTTSTNPVAYSPTRRPQPTSMRAAIPSRSRP